MLLLTLMWGLDSRNLDRARTLDVIKGGGGEHLNITNSLLGRDKKFNLSLVWTHENEYIPTYNNYIHIAELNIFEHDIITNWSNVSVDAALVTGNEIETRTNCP